MKRKALIIGALPSRFEGPWVEIGERKRWKLAVTEDFHGKVFVEVKVGHQQNDGSERFRLDYGKEYFLSGTEVRAVILDKFRGKTVSIVIEEVEDDS